MKKLAVAVIIRRKDGKVLGFRRSKDGFLGIPCGKVEEGEDLISAVKRECKEETGYDIDIIHHTPFVAEESSFTVHTYLARITSKGDPTHPDEGETLWCDPTDLTQGYFGPYNSKAFRFFGIPV